MKKQALMIAGGTGGHIFPALAVARALRKKDYDVQWLGSHVGMEKELVDREFPMSFVSVRSIRGKSVLSKLLSPFRLCLAIWQAWRVVRRLNPDVVIGMGGFVSGPGGVAAFLSKKPLIIHEQNAVAGMTNRLLSKLATVVLQAFPNAFPNSVVAKTIGNPVRSEISALASSPRGLAAEPDKLDPAAKPRDNDRALRLLVIGGSRGARAINEAMIRLLTQYPQPQQLTVWHQVGKLDFEKVQRAYCDVKVSVRLDAFVTDMVEAYAWADLMVCRAGALTVSEIAEVGVASLLIPFPYAVDDHQYYNGAYLVAAGAAEMIRQNQLTDDWFMQTIQKFVKDRSLLVDMAAKAKSLGKPGALSAIVAVCDELLGAKTI